VTTPTPGDVPAGRDEARVAVGRALNALGHAVVGRHVDGDLLDEIAATAAAWTRRAEGSPPRQRRRDAYLRDLEVLTPADGAAVRHFADCPISGPANPLHIIPEAVRDGDGVVVRTRLGPAYEGAPGRAHGGIVAAIFDDVMGFVTSMRREPAYQGQLTIRYVAPTPLDTELTIRAWPVERRGRTFTVAASIEAAGIETARATGVHVLVDPVRLVPPG
jgi:acyl-coenzyme A thioesterase PaaI-like protein